MASKRTNSQSTTGELSDDETSTNERKFGISAKFAIMFGVGFLLGVIAIFGIYNDEFDSASSLRATSIKAVSLQTDISETIEPEKAHIQNLDFLNPHKLQTYLNNGTFQAVPKAKPKPMPKKDSKNNFKNLRNGKNGKKKKNADQSDDDNDEKIDREHGTPSPSSSKSAPVQNMPPIPAKGSLPASSSPASVDASMTKPASPPNPSQTNPSTPTNIPSNPNLNPAAKLPSKSAPVISKDTVAPVAPSKPAAVSSSASPSKITPPQTAKMLPGISSAASSAAAAASAASSSKSASSSPASSPPSAVSPAKVDQSAASSASSPAKVDPSVATSVSPDAVLKSAPLKAHAKRKPNNLSGKASSTTASDGSLKHPIDT